MEKKPSTLWALAFGAISLLYVGYEFAFNAALLDLASSINQDVGEMDSLALTGETLTGIGMALAIMTLLMRFGPVARRGAFVSLSLLVLIATLVTVPFMRWAQPALIDHLIDGTTAEQRSEALGLNLFKFGVANGAVRLKSKLDTEAATLGESPADKTLLALIGPMAQGNEKIAQILRDSSKQIFDRVALEGGNSVTQRRWDEYQKVRNDVASRYNQYLDQAEEYESALRKASGKSGQVLDQIRQGVNADYAAHQSMVTKFEADYMAEEPTVSKRVRDFGKSPKYNRQIYERDLERIYGFVPDFEVYVTTRPATFSDAGTRNGNSLHYNLGDLIDLAETALTDKQVRQLTDESIHKGHLSLMDRAYAKHSNGMPRDLTLNAFMRQPQVCSKARAKLVSNNINVPSGWCPDDERAVMQSVDSEARKKIEREWEAGTKKRFGQVVGPDLTEQQFKNLKSVKDSVARALADAPCTKGNAYLSPALFKANCIDPELKKRRDEIREAFTAPTEELADGARLEEKGRQAVRSLAVPPVAMALSLFFSLLALLNFGLKLVSGSKVFSHWMFKLLCVGALIAAPMFMAQGKHGAIAELIFPDGSSVGSAFKWVIAMEPAIYNVGKQLPLSLESELLHAHADDFLAHAQGLNNELREIK